MILVLYPLAHSDSTYYRNKRPFICWLWSVEDTLHFTLITFDIVAPIDLPVG